MLASLQNYPTPIVIVLLLLFLLGMILMAPLLMHGLLMRRARSATGDALVVPHAPPAAADEPISAPSDTNGGDVAETSVEDAAGSGASDKTVSDGGASDETVSDGGASA